MTYGRPRTPLGRAASALLPAAALLGGCATTSGPATTTQRAPAHAPIHGTTAQEARGDDGVDPAWDKLTLDHVPHGSSLGVLGDEEPQPRSPRRPPVISLYGDDLIGRTPDGTMPMDGSANVRRITYTTEGATFDPAVDPSGQWLVFASTRHHPTSDLYLKSTRGTTVTQLTSDPAQDIMPSFDPAGKLIAFASDRSGNWDIFVKPVTGGQPIQLTEDYDHELHPSWSPDGRKLAYCKFGSQTGRWEIWVLDVEHPGTPSFLTFGVFPSWSPDVATNKILFQRARQRGSYYHSIWSVDYVNGEARNPTEIVSAGNAALINPAWSPDARKIVFVTVVDPENRPERPALSDIWTVNLDGTGRTNLTNGAFGNFQPVWAGDGTIFFVSNRSGNDNIWAVTNRSAEDAGRIVNVDERTQRPDAEP